MGKLLLGLLVIITSTSLAQSKMSNDQLLATVKSFAKTSAVTGREAEAAAFIKTLFAAGSLKQDKLGNLTVTIGSGSPKRLFTAPLDEPGYVVSQVQDDGYLRITPAGKVAPGTMYHQFMEGNEIKINKEKGIAYGVLTVPSSHYDATRVAPERLKPVFQWQEAFIDVGAASAAEVNGSGIHLLDPVTVNKKPQLIGSSIAAPAAKEKCAAIALAVVAQTLLKEKFGGTVVIAWTTLELITQNNKGLVSVIRQNGPFDEVVSFKRSLQLASKIKTTDLAEVTGAATSYVGLPSTYTYTPVEMVSVTAINELIQTWLEAVDNRKWTIAEFKNPGIEPNKTSLKSFTTETNILSKLISLYGVSTSEKPVRDHILSALPAWAKPTTDDKGNIILHFGKGPQHIAFVAHMDETGFLVDSIRNDGVLVLKDMGGIFNWVWEGHAALIHTADHDIPAVFEPRVNYLQATKRANENRLTVYAGFRSKEAALEAGVKEGATTVTMPKQMIRLSGNKATARGFDDRTGCAALLVALQQIDAAALPFRITFVWSVEEEIGLNGSAFAAKSLQDVDIVYPVDTYVSSDAPMESKIFGYCPLGKGAVIRVLESINFVGRDHLKYLQKLAAKNKINIQYGMTIGGTDGQEFLGYNIPSVPISWPGRYSHSPIEVMDFRDMNSLVKLIKAIMSDKNKIY